MSVQVLLSCSDDIPILLQFVGALSAHARQKAEVPNENQRTEQQKLKPGGSFAMIVVRGHIAKTGGAKRN